MNVMAATARAAIPYPHVSKTPGVCGGKTCIDGTRIRVNNVVFLHREGASDAKIRETYPDLTLAADPRHASPKSELGPLDGFSHELLFLAAELSENLTSCRWTIQHARIGVRGSTAP